MSADTVYTQLCESYRDIDGFRAKLLGFLPAASGAGILLTTKDPAFLNAWGKPIAIFGFLISCGLFSYEIYGIRKCAELIRTGRKLEIAQGVLGQFCGRPQSVWKRINEPFAAAIIYPVVLASWVIFFLETPCGFPSPPYYFHWIVWLAAILLAASLFRMVRQFDKNLVKNMAERCDACGRPVIRQQEPGATTYDPPELGLCRKCALAFPWIEERWMPRGRFAEVPSSR